MTVCTFAEFFGSTFKRLRKDAKLSQQDVATKGGFDRSYVTLIELGKKNPTMSVIEKMSSIVSPSVHEFFTEFVKDIGDHCPHRPEGGYCAVHGYAEKGQVPAYEHAHSLKGARSEPKAASEKNVK